MTLQIGHPLPAALLSCTVQGTNNSTETIGKLVAGQTTLLMFIRHFGCIGCSEHIALMTPHFSELASLGLRTVLIGCGAPIYLEGFLERHRLMHSPVELYTDDSLTAHREAGLQRSFWSGYGPRGLYEQARAFVGGHVSSGVQGDAAQQAGAIMTDQEGQVCFYHQSESLGDHAVASQIVATAMAMLLRQNPDLV